MSALRTLVDGLVMYARALTMVRYRVRWSNGPEFATYEEAVEAYRARPLAERQESEMHGGVPILMWWPGKGWMPSPHPHETKS